ncbi:MAG: glutathione S-transferase N-terminal domain-containing protein [Pseudomonadota bacterium]
MIDLYTWSTPNGRKVSILLEELGLPYQTHAINIGQDEQFTPEFLSMAPNNKIPAIRDRETGHSLMESGAIMLWLAEREGKFLGGPDGRSAMLEWLMWQMGGFGPILGRIHQFVKYKKPYGPFAEDWFRNEGARLYRVLNDRLAIRDFVAGEYSIADMAIWPWADRFEAHDTDLNDYPYVRDWFLRIAARPAVQAGYDVPEIGATISKP